MTGDVVGDLALGVDIGTGGVRAALIDRDCAPVAGAAAAMSEFGDNRRDPAIWEQALAAALSRLGEAADLGRVGAIAVDPSNSDSL